jgi:hypothetical protein
LIWDQTSEVSSIYNCVLDRGEGKTNTPKLQRRSASKLSTPCITRSSGGRPVSASIALVESVQFAPVIPKHASLFTLVSLLLAPAVLQPGYHVAGLRDGLSCRGPDDDLPRDVPSSLSPPRPVRFGPTQLTLRLLPAADLIRRNLQLTGHSTI